MPPRNADFYRTGLAYTNSQTTDAHLAGGACRQCYITRVATSCWQNTHDTHRLNHCAACALCWKDIFKCHARERYPTCRIGDAERQCASSTTQDNGARRKCFRPSRRSHRIDGEALPTARAIGIPARHRYRACWQLISRRRRRPIGRNGHERDIDITLSRNTTYLGRHGQTREIDNRPSWRRRRCNRAAHATRTRNAGRAIAHQRIASRRGGRKVGEIDPSERRSRVIGDRDTHHGASTRIEGGGLRRRRVDDHREIWIGRSPCGRTQSQHSQCASLQEPSAYAATLGEETRKSK